MMDPIAQAIRDEAKVGPFTPDSNAMYLLNRGESIRLNLHEAEVAANAARRCMGLRIIDDEEELPGVPAGSIGVDAHGVAVQRKTAGTGATWRLAGSSCNTFPGELALPVRFLQWGW